MIWDVSGRKKDQVWNHFIECWAIEKLGGGHAITAARLKYIKPIIFRDDHFWHDIVHCHELDDLTPSQLKGRKPGVYRHCLINFWGMICQSLMRHGKIKA